MIRGLHVMRKTLKSEDDDADHSHDGGGQETVPQRRRIRGKSPARLHPSQGPMFKRVYGAP